MSDRLEGKRVLIAGSAGAVGAAITKFVLEEGASVLAADFRKGALDVAMEPLSIHKERLQTVQLDVADENSWVQAAELAGRAFGGLDGLVNSAAILGRTGVEETTVERWRWINDVNLMGAWLGMKHLTPLLRTPEGSSVVFIGSVDALVGRGRAIAYQASKGGLLMAARSAATELAKDQIRVNTICPGMLAHTMTTIADEADPPTGMLERTPLGRPGQPDDIAWAAVYLLSDESSFVTGTELIVDGGFTAQ